MRFGISRIPDVIFYDITVGFHKCLLTGEWVAKLIICIVYIGKMILNYELWILSQGF